MARWLLDCRPLCGHPWRVGLATEPHEREAAYRLRYDVFFREEGYGPTATAADGRDTDPFDDWCEHVILFDDSQERVVGTYRAIPGTEAIRRGGFYGAAEFDLTPLDPIAPYILQGSRTCVAPEYRGGLSIQYLSYGMDLVRREYGCRYFLGADSFRADNPDVLNRIHAYARAYAADPDWYVEPLPANRPVGLAEVPANPADERLLPGVIRMDLRLGFRVCGPPAWDPDFRCYDLLVLARRDRMTRMYDMFVERIERLLTAPPALASPPGTRGVRT